MIYNFEYLSNLFDGLVDKDDFYFVQIIQRKKDGQNFHPTHLEQELLEAFTSLPRKSFSDRNPT